MLNKNPIISRIGLLTALVGFGIIGVFAAVSEPGDGIVNIAHALRDIQPGPIHHGGCGIVCDSVQPGFQSEEHFIFCNL